MSSPDAPKVMALSAEEAEWVSMRLQAAGESGLLVSPEALADAFDASRDDYFAVPAHERGDASMLVSIYSVAFGELISLEFDLQWCVVERGDSAEIALYGDTRGLVLYPLATVRRRWQDPARRPMLDLIEQTRSSVAGA